jgi:hypothetical protein
MLDLFTAIIMAIILAIIIAWGIKKYIKNWKVSPLLTFIIALVVACILMSAGGYADFSELWEGEGTTAQVTTPTGSTCAEFKLTPSVSSSEAVLNSDETTFTVASRANTTAHTITESDNTTWVNPVLQFVLKPDAGSVPEADADKLATIYYEVTNPDITTTDGTDTYPLFTKSSGKRQLIWAGDSTEYVDGSSTMLLTENLTLTLTMTCSQDSYSRMENTYDPVRVYVRFYNDCGWSETYFVDFMLIETWT